jgi:hypothetical protein
MDGRGVWPVVPTAAAQAGTRSKSSGAEFLQFPFAGITVSQRSGPLGLLADLQRQRRDQLRPGRVRLIGGMAAPLQPALVAPGRLD